MSSNDAPGTRTTELLPALPDEIRAALRAAGSDWDPATDVPEPQDAPPIRWGILGAGGIAGRFATEVPNLSSGRVSAVGSRDKAKAQAFIDARPAAAKAGPVRAHGSYEDLVADQDVDAVYVATPHSLHAEHALMALAAGKPVLVEKPLTMNADQARQVLRAAQGRHLFAMEAMWTRFLPGQLLVHALLEAGVLGDLRHARADHHQWLLHVERMVSPSLAGGALLDLGVYPLSFLHAVMGVPRSMEVVGRLTPAGVDAEEIISMRYASASAVACCGMDGAGASGAQVIGERARIELPSWFYGPVPVTLTWRGDDGVDRPSTWDARVPGGFQFQAAEVARCLEAGLTESPTHSWEAAVEVMEMMDQVRSRLGVVYPGE